MCNYCYNLYFCMHTFLWHDIICCSSIKIHIWHIFCVLWFKKSFFIKTIRKKSLIMRYIMLYCRIVCNFQEKKTQILQHTSKMKGIQIEVLRWNHEYYYYSLRYTKSDYNLKFVVIDNKLLIIFCVYFTYCKYRKWSRQRHIFKHLL